MSGHPVEGGAPIAGRAAAPSSLPRVAFVCVHNSCRSQMAEALGKLLAADTFESHSAGTHAAAHINPDAVRLMKARYAVDMAQAQRPKLLCELPPVDIVVTMGCNVDCPHLPCRHREDWGLIDPTGQSDEAFASVMDTIAEKIRALRDAMRDGASTALHEQEKVVK